MAWYEPWRTNEEAGRFFLFTFIAIFAFIVAAVVASTLRHNRLLDDCLADGRPEYECESLLHGGGR